MLKPKPYEIKGMAEKPIKGCKLVVRATLIGHSPKGLWVAQAITGGGLFAFPLKKEIMKERLKKIGKGIGIILIMWLIISAGMIEIAGSAGILWGAVITCVIILCIYIYYKPECFF